MRKITFVIMIALLSYCSVIAKNPSVSARNYWPGMYNDNNSWGNYKLGYWHKEAFHVSWGVAYKDPAVGYPYRSVNTDGVNDTVKVMVYFDNRTDDDYPIASATPQDWFYPVLYDPYVDVFDTPMLADTSTFEYRFENWITMSKGVITTKPDTIFSSPNRGYHLTYGLIYSMWGLTPGTFRVILKPTATKPSDVKLVVDASQNLFTMSTSQDILDTLNSYCTISINALSRKEFTLFNTYVNNIFTLNSKSLLDWALRYHGYNAQDDTTNALIALDSMLYNLENRIDPLIPDTSEITPIHEAWLDQWNVDYKYYQERLLYPRKWIGYPK